MDSDQNELTSYDMINKWVNPFNLKSIYKNLFNFDFKIIILLLLCCHIGISYYVMFCSWDCNYGPILIFIIVGFIIFYYKLKFKKNIDIFF